MNLENKYISSQVAEPEINGTSLDVDKLALNQWILINRAESHYKGQIVEGTSCRFEDNVWFNGDNKVGERGLIWDSRFTLSKGLEILLRIVYFEMASTRKNSIKTISDKKIHLLKKSILPLIQSKNLLAGKDGEYLLGLSEITDDDLQVVVDGMLASAYSEESFVQECFDLVSLFEYVNYVAENVPVFRTVARFPWQKIGISINRWVKRRAKDLVHTFRTPIGFAPLATETINPIIEWSLKIILDLGEHVGSVSQMLAHFDKQLHASRYAMSNREIAELAVEKYGPIFEEIIPTPQQNVVSKAFIRGVIAWARKLLYLARAACINIILLTSGLRNSDVRNLRVNCCRPSGRVDMLFYLDVRIRKTRNHVVLPVPEQTHKAILLLISIKFSKSEYLLDGGKYRAGVKRQVDFEPDIDERMLTGESINETLRSFAGHFKIPFSSGTDETLDSAHCYRTTVAGWLASASALSVLMVRRLFGHSNDVMPSVYLRNNPSFIEERKEAMIRAAASTARNMAQAAATGQISGIKGEQLEAGFRLFASQFEMDKSKSHSLTDNEVVTNFAKILEQRLLDDNMFGFVTPFGVLCGRNPNDTSQAPCGRRSHRDKTAGVDQLLLDSLSVFDPANCIGGSCKEAMIGPWSESIKESLLWYATLVRHQLGDAFSAEHFKEHAIAFIRQYSEPVKKVFRIEVLQDGSVHDSQCAKGQ